MAKKRYKSEVAKPFKKKNKKGDLVKYEIGDYFYTTDADTVEYFKQIKLIK